MQSKGLEMHGAALSYLSTRASRGCPSHTFSLPPANRSVGREPAGLGCEGEGRGRGVCARGGESIDAARLRREGEGALKAAEPRPIRKAPAMELACEGRGRLRSRTRRVIVGISGRG
jgi:hypothetical protein